MMQKTSLLTFVLAVFAGTTASSEQLSNEAVYHRCYSQLTQLRAPSTDARLAAVKAGTKDPIAACMEVFDLALLTAGGGTSLTNTADPIALAVLRNFQGLHYSWFHAKQFEMLNGSSYNWLASTMDLLDPSSPALYYTKALFDPNASFSSVVTRAENLRPVRSNGVPTRGVYSGASAGSFAAGMAAYFVQTGELIGINASDTMTAGGISIGTTAGGGFLGTGPYIQLTAAVSTSFSSDGALNVPRRWGRDIFLDTMCRSLPVVRDADAAPFVIATSPTSFRQSTGCVKCHASMDRISGAVRNIAHVTTTTDGNAHSPIAISFKTVTKAAETAWPSSSDSSYSTRPPNGVLYYRNYDGVLIDKSVTSIADLGAKIAAEDDLYICAAKRYIAYFMGAQAEIGDIADPVYNKNLSAADLKVRQLAIDLGKKLKTSQKARSLIEEILRLPQYRLSDYGLTQ